MINDNIIANLHQKFEFLQHCDKKNRQEFIKQAIYVQLRKSDHVCQQGNNCTHLALLLKGTVRVYKLAETGREITLYRIHPSQSCILTASCIQSNSTFPAFAICDSPIEAVLIPSAYLQKCLDESAVWRHYIFGLISQRMSSVISLVEEVAFRKLDQRIACLLLQYQQKNHSPIIQVTHQKIALELGTSREVVSRILIDFQQDGMIKLIRGSITILNYKKINHKANKERA
jgi:CRP/FNR family transcriptional regulator